MIKNLLSFAAVAALAVSSVNAADPVTLWEGTCDFGTAWSESFAVDAGKFDVLDNNSATLHFEYTLNADCQYWQYKPCSNGEGWTPLNVATELGNDYQCISVFSGTTSADLPLEAEDIATIKANGLRVQGYGMTVTKVTYAEEGPAKEYTETPLNIQNGTNVLLSEYENYADEDIIRVTLSISNAESSVAPGWGVGGIFAMNNWDGTENSNGKFGYEFTCKEVSAEGALNNYDFTVAQFKDLAKVGGEYFVDSYDQKGVTMNLYNGASLASVTALVEKKGTVGINNVAIDENAPVEYYNLQGVKVANPANGIYVVRQGNKVSKVLVK